MRRLIYLFLILLLAFPAWGADYTENKGIDGLADVSAVVTKATLVPVQDMDDLDKIGSVTIEGLVNEGLKAPGAIGDTTPAAGHFTLLTGKRTAVGAADYNPSALTTDYIIAMTDTAAARAVTISTEDEDSGSTSQPRIMIVKDESGGAAAQNIIVTLESGGTIDGAANYVINQNYQSITLYIDGTNAHIY